MNTTAIIHVEQFSLSMADLQTHAATLSLVSSRYKQAAFCYEELLLSSPLNPLYNLTYAEVRVRGAHHSWCTVCNSRDKQVVLLHSRIGRQITKYKYMHILMLTFSEGLATACLFVVEVLVLLHLCLQSLIMLVESKH